MKKKSAMMTNKSRTLRNAYKAEYFKKFLHFSGKFSHLPLLDYIQQRIGCRFSWYRHPLNLTVCITKDELEAWKKLTEELNEIGENGIFDVRNHLMSQKGF